MTEGSQLRGREVRSDIEAAILASCPGVDEIVFGRTVKPRTSRFARVYMPEVSFDGENSTQTQTHQEYVAMIALTFPMSDAEGMTIPDAAEDAINPLIAELTKSAHFGEVRAFAPKIRSVQFDDDSESDEPVFEVGLEFVCSLHAPYIRRE